MRFLSTIGALAILIAIGAGVFFFGGFFNIAASVEDSEPVKWALTRVREASISRHATDQPPASFGAADSVRKGALAFSELGCVRCHGAPGVQWEKFSEGMNPDPPDLKKVVATASPAQLFYVVRNGIKMTGMPSFSAAGAPDEKLWTVIAFLKKLPEVSEADYKAWTSSPAEGK